MRWRQSFPWRRMEEERYSSTILDLCSGWREVVSFTLRPLYPGESAPDTHWIGGWVGPRTSLNTGEKRIISAPAGNRTPTVQSLYRLSYPGSNNNNNNNNNNNSNSILICRIWGSYSGGYQDYNILGLHGVISQKTVLFNSCLFTC
jgi:hypothetical protein